MYISTSQNNLSGTFNSNDLKQSDIVKEWLEMEMSQEECSVFKIATPFYEFHAFDAVQVYGCRKQHNTEEKKDV